VRRPPVIRPGPQRIEPGQAPGGIVAHWYDRDGRLLLARALPADSAGKPVDVMGAADMARAVDLADDDVCCVAYDGDDGSRLPPPWL
jgi:hypothetical protein